MHFKLWKMLSTLTVFAIASLGNQNITAAKSFADGVLGKPNDISSHKSNLSTPIEIAQTTYKNRNTISEQRNRLPRKQPEFPSPKPSDSKPVLPTPTPEPSPKPPQREQEQPEVQIPVQKIEVVGSTVFDSKELDLISKPLEGRSVTLTELRKVAESITQLYLQAGYVTSNAVLTEQEIRDGIVKIQVIEGSLQEIKIEGNRRLNNSYIRQRVKRGITTPLRADLITEQLLLLKEIDPLVEDVQGILRRGDTPGKSVLVVKVKEVNPLRLNLSTDNYSAPSLGSERLGVGLSYRNLTGIGDEISAAYRRSTTGGTSIWDLNYRVPVNPMNGSLQLRTVFDRNKVTQGPGSELDIEGESELYDISFRQPIIRSFRKGYEELALSVGFSYRDGQTFLGNEAFGFGVGPDENGVSRTSAFRFGQEYVKWDRRGGWSFFSQFSIGTELFNATTNDSPTPDSRFFSWLGQAQRVQRFSRNNQLIVQASLQLTPDSLLSSEQFVIGGGQSLRGYRQNVRAGDNGFRLSLEDQITLQRDENENSIVVVAPFIDLGAVWNHPDNPNNEFQPSQRFLAGAGLGLILQPVPDMNIRVDYAVPFIDLDDKGNNAQDEGLYFSVNYGF